ncbi:hypothetical protein MCOR34_007677 [Pyricularia oryzae]|nr:hypothetical protein MCOR34_007677 [Pyricularia oryzae]KAI6465103.1 hypothetical protein MCOR17_005149 [Pyricularia oryzae]KAI6586262.1 hypothetical protein MCOR04_004515 [Pyricularia oryzae]
MFSTLKCASGATGYVVEPAEPPFNKRQKVLARVACAYCREKKLRCSGEPEGCQRCLARSIECVYLSQRASPAGHRRQSSTATLASSDISSISTLAPSTAEETSQDKLMMWGDDDVWNYTEGLEDMQWPGAAVMNRATIVTLEDTSCTNTRATDNLGHRGSISSAQSPIDKVSRRTTPRHSTPLTTVSDAAFGCCDCINQLLQQNEKLSITLFTGRAERKPCPADIFTNAIWRCHKDSMASCEALLSCDSCSSRSELVILAIGMCRMIMTSIEDIHAQLRSNVLLDDDLRSEQSQYRSPRAGDKRTRDDVSGSEERQRSRSPLSGQWDLDEDELHIVRGLLDSRVARIGCLLTKIRQITVARHWPGCETMNEGIRKRHAFIAANAHECRL